MKTIGYYLKLMRWFHELVAIIPFMGLYFVIQYTCDKENIVIRSQFTDFLILCFNVQLLIAAGCVLNDLMDHKIDKVNKPRTHLIGRVISIRNAWITFGFLSVISIGLTIWITIRFFADWWWISFTVYLLSISYDVYFKRSPLMGNILIAIITAFIPLVIQFYCYETLEALNHPKINLLILLYAGISFLVIVPRELSLDISDMEGDKADSCKTLPLVIGVRKSKIVVRVMLLVNIAIAVFMAVWFPYLAVSLTIVAVGHVYYMFLIKRCETRIEYIRAGRFIWFIMILGLLGFTVSTLI